MKLIKFLSLSLLIATLTSCTFTENIDIADNGSGKFSLDMDGSALMAMAGQQLGNEVGDATKSIDSTFAFKEMFKNKKDSIAKLSPEAKKELEKLENFVVHMKMNVEQKQLLLDLKTDFKSVSELQDMMKTMSTLQNIEKNKASDNKMPFNGDFSNNSTVSFSYDGKKFNRKVALNSKETNKPAEDSLGMYKMIFASSTYIIKYRFPKKVKKVSNADAMFSEDRKTITIQYPFTDYMENPTKMGLEVEFEK
ncbi:hypothetical protein [Flavobacterium hydatis]|jgi:hypothetical protein|uniref:Lipoprotein n=1 Tax=Flavobacterium hydatis TaxID=991 RepID=A0A086AQ18_FLAHY|nr:hypothetical protein [Flavobacterium hydatis]KFF18782.1 hypothetical protein IW20_04220 [Flavobacterium hydatis]OXA88801.1 hypothetical protein B0A62_21405 [Flavobacterium hydatis]